MARNPPTCPAEKRSERIRGGCQWMFIHWSRNIRDIMRSHISRWIMETVKEAYTWAEMGVQPSYSHELRALSASWAYNCQVVLPDILSHNKSWIQDIFSHLHGLHDLYAATPTAFLMKITWLISWYLYVWKGVAVARNPPACPAEKRSLGENLVNDRQISCSAQVRLCMEAGMWLNFDCFEISYRDWLASQMYAATATPSWRYRLIIR